MYLLGGRARQPRHYPRPRRVGGTDLQYESSLDALVGFENCGLSLFAAQIEKSK